MKVQEVLLENQSKRYILLDYAGLPLTCSSCNKRFLISCKQR